MLKPLKDAVYDLSDAAEQSERLMLLVLWIEGARNVLSKLDDRATDEPALADALRARDIPHCHPWDDEESMALNDLLRIILKQQKNATAGVRNAWRAAQPSTTVQGYQPGAQAGADAFKQLLRSIKTKDISTAFSDEREQLEQAVLQSIRLNVAEADDKHAKAYASGLAELLSAVVDGVIPSLIDSTASSTEQTLSA